MIENIPIVHSFLGIASLALMAIGTGVSTIGGLKQAKLQQTAQRMRADQLKIEAARERTRQIRAGRAARAQVQQAGANSGGESSSVQTGAAGAMAQAFGNIVGINQQESAGIGQARIAQDIAAAKGTQTLGQGISEMGSVFASNQDEIADIFGIKTE